LEEFYNNLMKKEKEEEENYSLDVFSLIQYIMKKRAKDIKEHNFIYFNLELYMPNLLYLNIMELLT
jgi:hypothetical protein